MEYSEMISALKRQFPSGTVQFREDNHRPYIPNQVYTDRVESATGSQWDLEIKDLDINIPYKYVKAIVRIQIGPHFRDGYGLSIIQGEPSEQPNRLKIAIDSAVNSAFVEALDKYQVGWIDLAPYKTKDWASNPALQHLLAQGAPVAGVPVQSQEQTVHQCLICKRPLSSLDWDFLGKVPNLNRSKMTYCFKDLPDHLKRRVDNKTVQEYEQQQTLHPE